MSSACTNTPAISALTVYRDSNTCSCGTLAATRNMSAAVTLHRNAEQPRPPKALRAYGTTMRVAIWLRKVSAWAAMA